MYLLNSRAGDLIGRDTRAQRDFGFIGMDAGQPVMPAACWSPAPSPERAALHLCQPAERQQMLSR